MFEKQFPWLLTLLCLTGVCAGFAQAEDLTAGVHVRVGAYNVLFGNWARPQHIGEMFKAHDLDVIGFNEVPDGRWTAKVGRQLGMKYAYVGKIASANHKDKYKSILSRTPLTNMHEIEINAEGWKPASMAGADTTIRGVSLRVYSLHIPGRPYFTDKAAGSAAEFIAKEVIPKIDAERFIIMGDFNSHVGDAPFNKIEQAGMRASWEDIGFNVQPESTHQHIETGVESGVIDHIFYNVASGAKACGGGIIKDAFNPPDEDKSMPNYRAEWEKYGKPLSDHRPIWAELVYPETAISHVPAAPEVIDSRGKRPVTVDWLVTPVTRPVEVQKFSEDGLAVEIALTNGLIRRAFRIHPNGATVAFDNLMTGESILRAVKPEATVQLDGVNHDVGGLTGQVEQAYLRPEWVPGLKTNPEAFQYTGYTINPIKARVPWKRNRYAQEVPWPPPGLELVMTYAPPAALAERYAGLKVMVHYEMYQGIPVLSKRISVVNGTDRTVTLDRFVSEILATVDYEVPEELMAPDPWQPANIHIESDYSLKSNTKITTHWVYDPAYTTQQYQATGKAPNTMMSHLPLGPDVAIKPGGAFESFRTFELVYDSTERERKSLSVRRMYRTVAPWVTENPIFWHAASAEPDYIRRAIDQSAEVGFEMLIMTFGSGLDMLSEDPEYIATYKALADYAHGKGIELGGYSLLSSTNPGPDYEVVMPKRAALNEAVYTEYPNEPFVKQWLGSPRAKPSIIFGHSPCLCSQWMDDYLRRLKHFIEQTGFDLLEHDGSYPGNVCASTIHNGHKGLADSQWLQRERMRTFYSWCRDKGLYINDPDWYMLTGANKGCMTYREDNNALPRERQVILFRQNIYDGTWNKTPSMGWMFVPLMDYKGGGAAAVMEPLNEHLDIYESHLAQNFGSGVQACYRGPRLYDTDATKAVVKKWVDFYKAYRGILDSDIIHVRRPDGRDIDCMLHVNAQLKHKGLAMMYNPTSRRIVKELRLPLYYTGLTDIAQIRHEGGEAKSYTLDRTHNVSIPLDMKPDSVTWYVIE